MADFDDLQRSFFDGLYTNRIPVAFAVDRRRAWSCRRRLAAGWFAGRAPPPGPVGRPPRRSSWWSGLPVGYYLASPIWIRTVLVEPDPVAAATGSRAVTPVPTADRIAHERHRRELPYRRRRPHPRTDAGRDPVRRAPDRLRVIPRHRRLPFRHGARPRSSRRRPARTSCGSRTSPSATARTSTSTCRRTVDDYVEGALELGKLKATDGAFGYALPAGTDPADFASAIIWCKQFSHLFAVAPLAAA